MEKVAESPDSSHRLLKNVYMYSNWYEYSVNRKMAV